MLALSLVHLFGRVNGFICSLSHAWAYRECEREARRMGVEATGERDRPPRVVPRISVMLNNSEHPTQTGDTVIVSVSMTRQLADDLQAEAQRRGLSRSGVIREAVLLRDGWLPK